MKILYLSCLIIYLLLNSCATILNRPTQNIDFYHSSDIKILTIKQDSNIINPTKNSIYVNRSSHPIKIKYLNHSDTFTRELSSFLSNSYWWNIYFNYGIGMIGDELSDKKNAYLRKFYITDDNYLVKEKKSNQNIYIGSEYSFLFSKNYTWVTIMPYNIFIGYEYYHEHNQFLSIEESIGAYLGGEKNNRNGFFNAISTFNFKNNYIFNNFEVGYGLSIHNSIYHNKIGMAFSGTNMMSKTFGLMLDINTYMIEFNPHYSTYLAPQFRIKFLFKIPLNN